MSTARKLDKVRMVRFDERTQYMHSTDLGRTASHFYIKYPSIEVRIMFGELWVNRENFVERKTDT